MPCELPGFKIETLGDHHLRGAFSCGLQTIDTFFQKKALKDHVAYKVRVRVAVAGDDASVVGFYSLALKGLTARTIPGKITSKFGSWAIPAVYLSMIASSTTEQGKGVGGDLLLHAFRSTLDIADLAGTACLTLDAVDEEKAAWYEARSFVRFGPEGLTEHIPMYIPLATVRAACEAVDNAVV